MPCGSTLALRYLKGGWSLDTLLAVGEEEAARALLGAQPAGMGNPARAAKACVPCTAPRAIPCVPHSNQAACPQPHTWAPMGLTGLEHGHLEWVVQLNRATEGPAAPQAQGSTQDGRPHGQQQQQQALSPPCNCPMHEEQSQQAWELGQVPQQQATQGSLVPCSATCPHAHNPEPLQLPAQPAAMQPAPTQPCWRAANQQGHHPPKDCTSPSAQQPNRGAQLRAACERWTDSWYCASTPPGRPDSGCSSALSSVIASTGCSLVLPLPRVATSSDSFVTGGAVDEDWSAFLHAVLGGDLHDSMPRPCTTTPTPTAPPHPIASTVSAGEPMAAPSQSSWLTLVRAVAVAGCKYQTPCRVQEDPSWR